MTELKQIQEHETNYYCLPIQRFIHNILNFLMIFSILYGLTMAIFLLLDSTNFQIFELSQKNAGDFFGIKVLMSMLSLILILVLKIILHIWNENTIKIVQKLSPEFEYYLAILETHKPYNENFPKQAQLLTALELEKKLFNASDPIIFDTPTARSSVSDKNTPAGFINNRKIEKI